MVFTGNPVELRQWVVTDDVGETTTVILNDLRSGTSINNSMFNIIAETNKRG